MRFSYLVQSAIRSSFAISVTLMLTVQGADASTVFEDFSTWTMSDTSVVGTGGQLTIGTGSGNNDRASKPFLIDLTPGTKIILEQRVKLQYGGLNYRLPYQFITFGDSSEFFVTYLPDDPPGSNTYGWAFDGGFTGIVDPEVPGDGWWTSATADHWAVTQIELTSTGGVLRMKPDDAAQGWFSTEFTEVTSTGWSHSQITEIAFEQPWDSVNHVDYFSITTVPEPNTALLLGVGLAGLAMRRRR